MRLKVSDTSIIVFILLAGWGLATFSGCDYYTYQREACNNCLNAKPDSGDLVIRFNPASHNNPVHYIVYEGGHETGIKVVHGIATTEEHTYLLETDITYSVAATYTHDGHTTIVINHGKIKTRKYGCSDSNSGDVTHYCWYAIPAEVDVELKTQP